MPLIPTVLIDDHVLFSDGLKKLLEESGRFKVIAQFSNGLTFLNSIEDLDPELLIIDIEIPGIKGLDVLRRLRLKKTSLKIIMLSSHEESVFKQEALSSGANGYLSKSLDSSKVIDYFEDVMRGENTFPGIGPMLKTEVKILSKQELTILKLIAAGKTSEVIAKELGISTLTVKAHRRNMMQKLKAESSSELISNAFSKGIL
jgi:DNA-binding NarL/FixJ family response regulator